MDNWGPQREVEKPKSLTQQRVVLKAKALERAAQLERRADAVVMTLGGGPLVTELRDAAQLLKNLAGVVR